MTEDIGYWFGEPISTMEREELLEVIKFLCKDLERERKDRDNYREAKGDILKYMELRRNAT